MTKLNGEEPGLDKRNCVVDVIEHSVHFDSMAFSTLTRMGVTCGDPGSDEDIEFLAKAVLSNTKSMGNLYVNPMFTVSSEPDLPINAFVREARKAQRTWLKRLGQILHGSRRVKRAIKQATPLTRQLAFTGVLIINGKHQHPKQWPVTEVEK